MNILKLLAPLEALEAHMADLYEWFSQQFSGDTEAASFFYRMSVEEVVHANIVKYQRRLVSRNPRSFGEVDLDIFVIERALDEVASARHVCPHPSLEGALSVACLLEQSAAEKHYLTAIEKANPDVSRLLRGLGAFDSRHFEVFREFAVKRGFLPAEGDAIPAPADEGEMENKELPAGDILERINYLHKWFRSMGYYRFLGVREYATTEQIKHAYLNIVKEFHPDRYFNAPEQVLDKLKEISQYAIDAHETLMNPDKRKKYNASQGSAIRR